MRFRLIICAYSSADKSTRSAWTGCEANSSNHPRIKSEGMLSAEYAPGFERVRPPVNANMYYLLSLFLPALSPFLELALIPVVVPDFILLDFILFILPDFIF